MSPGQYQQKLKDELGERFVAGPAPAAMRAMLAAADRESAQLLGSLRRARERIKTLERDLDDAYNRLAKARSILAENDPARYWKECRGL